MGNPGLVAASILLITQMVIVSTLDFEDKYLEEQYVPKRKCPLRTLWKIISKSLLLKMWDTSETNICELKTLRRRKSESPRRERYKRKWKRGKLKFKASKKCIEAGTTRTVNNWHEAQLMGIRRTAFDADSTNLMIDDGASECIANSEADCVGKARKVHQ